MRWRYGLSALLLCLAPLALAQVEVIESQPQGGEQPGLYPTPRGQADEDPGLYPRAQQSRPRQVVTAPTRAPGGGNSAAGDLYFQLQALQQELMELRGLVEEHEQTIRQLKQQRLDDYMSLDRRIGELLSGAGAETSPGLAASPAEPGVDTAEGSPSESPGVSAGPPSADEEQRYRDAYGLIRERRFPEATAAFEGFLSQFPGSALAANAYYWLGELYMLEGRNDAARQRFEALLGSYPDNRKVPDAMFKLAKVYHLEGRNGDARRLLEELGRQYPDSSAARLAAEYLQQNF